MTEPVHELLIAAEVVVTGDVEHGMDQLMREHLLAVAAAQGGSYFDAVLVREPDAHAILAVLPLARGNRPHLNRVAG